MPEVKSEIPVALRPFTFFGVEVDYDPQKDQSTATCPFCDREGKFYINNQSGQWQCKVCGEDGNVYSFLKRTWEESDWIEGEAEELAADRRISVQTLNKWELRIHDATEDWIVAGYNAEGRIANLYRRTWNHLEKRFYWQGPKGLNQALFGMPLWEQSKDDVFLCEGIWDAMALWELLTTTKAADHEGNFLPTSNPELCLYVNANVLAVPSANVFNEYWPPLFAGKRVYLCYDNDHPARSKATGVSDAKKNGGCAGLEGMKRVANILFKAADPPKEVHYLKWGDGTTKTGLVGYDPGRKHGFDLRDLLTSSQSQSERRSKLKELFSMFEPVPPAWVEGAKGSKGKPVIGTLECTKYEDALAACRKALIMTPQMERGLANMMAVAALVPCGGDQLWMKFIGPPSSGKTTLADGLIIARKYACMKSITTGLHSGYREKDDDGDYSLMNAIKDMAVIVKDGDTLLKAENVERILSELRDAYDRNSSTHFRNKVQREYLNHSFALLIFGTERMKELDQSELGQRFIDCVMMDEIDINHERETNLHIGRRLRNLFAVQMSLNGEGTEGRELMEAKQMIGGFLEHLRRNILYLFSEVRCSDEMLEKFDLIAQFVAYFRSRPSTMQNPEADTRELSHRLYQQFCKLAYGLCCVLGKKDVDDEIIARVALCGLDTARGNTTKIAKALVESIKRTKVTEGKGKNRKNKFITSEGLDLGTLSTRVNLENRDIKKLLIFMRGIKIVETTTPKNKVGVGSRLMKWTLTLHAKKLYNAVHEMTKLYGDKK